MNSRSTASEDFGLAWSYVVIGGRLVRSDEVDLGVVAGFDSDSDAPSVSEENEVKRAAPQPTSLVALLEFGPTNYAYFIDPAGHLDFVEFPDLAEMHEVPAGWTSWTDGATFVGHPELKRDTRITLGEALYGTTDAVNAFLRSALAPLTRLCMSPIVMTVGGKIADAMIRADVANPSSEVRGLSWHKQGQFIAESYEKYATTAQEYSAFVTLCEPSWAFSIQLRPRSGSHEPADDDAEVLLGIPLFAGLGAGDFTQFVYFSTYLAQTVWEGEPRLLPRRPDECAPVMVEVQTEASVTAPRLRAALMGVVGSGGLTRLLLYTKDGRLLVVDPNRCEWLFEQVPRGWVCGHVTLAASQESVLFACDPSMLPLILRNE